MTVPETPLPKPLLAYAFRPMAGSDLDMVRGWQLSPHVQAWWDDEALTLAQQDEPELEQYIVTGNGRPFAYLQCYLQGQCGLQGAGNGLGRHPPGTRGIDQFIGVPEMVGRGHGSAFIGAFAARLLAAGVPRVITDPNPANVRAIRAYAKAGFRAEREVDTPDGRALLMVRDAAHATAR